MKKINTICIIDDDPITVFGIKKMLNAIEAAEVIKTYVNGKQALDEITAMVENQEEIPEVIFLDINMPIMDGWQFLEKFIELPIEKKIRINVVTSSIDPYDKQQWELYNSKTHHVVDYKNKPIRKGDIIEITKAA
jgi:CheY-like chemotaxis protein